jgi:menaquinone-specific isochorismate synthase
MNTKSVLETTIGVQQEPLPLKDAIALMSDNIETAIETASHSTHAYHQLRIPITPMNPLAWLSAQTITPSLFWESRDKTFATAGVGAVEHITHHDHADPAQVLNELCGKLSATEPQLRFYGGFRFDNSTPGSMEWNRFGRSFFFIPRIELQKAAEQLELVLTIKASDNPEQIRTQLNQLRIAETETTNEPIFVDEISERPIRSEWESQVELALSRFTSDALQKVVLSRQQIINCVTPVDPTTLLSRVAAQSGQGVSFLLSPDNHSHFLGHSPERLYRRDGRTIHTEAVAGTRMRGKTEAEDTRLAKELLTSEKEQREQQIVSVHIANKLQELCSQVTIPAKPQILKLGRLQHLVTSFTGQLKQNVNDGDILSSLHPTPAVAGFPVQEALTFLANHESYDRGWYAGPVGWVSSDSAEFIVAIRSALVQGNTARLFAGSGIVTGSIASVEWEETEQKLSGFRKLFSQ